MKRYVIAGVAFACVSVPAHSQNFVLPTNEIDLSKTIVIITNPNGQSAIYKNMLKVGNLTTTAVKPHCDDLNCGPPAPPPRPTCHGPFCPGGMPFLQSEAVVFRNTWNAKLPAKISQYDYRQSIAQNEKTLFERNTEKLKELNIRQGLDQRSGYTKDPTGNVNQTKMMGGALNPP
ncbi:hypothetical protein [Tardiphaga sp. 839_C3_N1_4]|uniref:hypothetical protein n=1 Tax=Tardiphaga sp. 839_C3_N1_4 TaxID=3240761 RepID=UPI003F2803EB